MNTSTFAAVGIFTKSIPRRERLWDGALKAAKRIARLSREPDPHSPRVTWDTHRIAGAQIDDITFYDNLKPDLARIMDRSGIAIAEFP